MVFNGGKHWEESIKLVFIFILLVSCLCEKSIVLRQYSVQFLRKLWIYEKNGEKKEKTAFICVILNKENESIKKENIKQKNYSQKSSVGRCKYEFSLNYFELCRKCKLIV